MVHHEATIGNINKRGDRSFGLCSFSSVYKPVTSPRFGILCSPRMSVDKNTNIEVTQSYDSNSNSSGRNQNELEQNYTPPANNKHLTYNKEKRAARFANGPSFRDVIMIVSAGFALISDGYQNSVLTMSNLVLAKEFPDNYDSTMKTRVSNAALVGTIFGQLSMGIVADYYGRKVAIVAATVFLVFGTCLAAASHGKSTEGLLWMLIVARGVTGYGIGAEYPSSSVSASEAANESVKKQKGTVIMVTNFPLSIGSPFALIIFLIVYQITKNNDALWRTLFAIGAFFPLSVFYFRLKMATSEVYKKNALTKNVPYWLAIKFYWKKMIGTCVCWFLYDFVTFPNGIFSGGIIGSVIDDPSNLERIAEWNLLLGVILIPGVVIGALVIDKIGVKYCLAIGFSGYIIFGLIVGIAYDKISKIVPLFIVFYGLMMCMSSFGPGNCMGISSLYCYCTPMRGFFYAVSAVCGKVGAVVGVQCFTPIQDNLGKKWTFIIAAICGILGVLVGYFFVPHLKEDDVLLEDIRFRNYLLDNGYKGEFGTGEKNDSDFDDAISVEEVDASLKN